MSLPPSPFDQHPDPLGSEVVPTEGVQHPEFGQVGEWIDKAMASEPSAGTIGRMELLRAWDQLPADGRKQLVRAARVLLAREKGNDR